MRTMGWQYPVTPTPWDQIDARFADFAAAHPTFEHMSAIVRSVRTVGADGDLAAFTSVHGIGDQFWCTQRFTEPPIVFVHTDEQAQTLRTSPLRDTWADTYFEIAKRYDEFGYLDRTEIAIMVDSKENFETNYAGNWYYYFK
jgi:hypothetical protein